MPCSQRLAAPGDRYGVALPRAYPPFTGVLSCPYQLASCHGFHYNVAIRSVRSCQRPRRAALLKPVVPQLVHGRYAYCRRLQRPVVPAVRGPHAAVHCVAGSQQLPPVIRGVRIHRPAGVVKGVIRQKVVAGVVSPVVSVVPVLRLPLHPVVHLYQRSRLGCACV